MRQSSRCRPGPLLLLATLLCAANSTAADITDTLFDGRGASEWDTRRDQARLQTELAQSSLRAVQSPARLEWRFVSRGPTFNDIFLDRPIALPFRAIRVRVRNLGAPITLAAKAADAGHAEWTTRHARLGTSPEWRWVEFPATQWRPASWSHDADGRMDFPLRYFTLIAFDVAPGAEYRLEVARVEAVRPDPPIATVSALSVPRRLVHGRSYRATVRLRLDRPCNVDGAWLVFRRAGRERFRVPVPLGAALTLRSAAGRTLAASSFTLPVPEFAAGGLHTVTLQIGDARAVLAGGKREASMEVEVMARRPGHTAAAVRMHNGVPTLFINGKPHDGMAYTAYGPSEAVFRDFSRAGVTLFSFSATPTDAGYGLSRTAWTAPGVYDFSELDDRVAMVLRANPNAYFFPRLYLHAPKWWSARHPDDTVLFDPGDGKPIPFVHAGSKPAPSWASEAWRRDTVEGLRRLIAHVQASPWADRCIGYHLASGTTEEWMMWGANEDQWVDYSLANVRGFRKWLRARYGTDTRLREAWSDPSASLDAAAIPTKAERQACGFGSLRDPDREQAVVDFYRYNSDLVADTICYFAREVKRIAGHDRVVGAFYGYLLQLCGEQRQQNAGHLALERVLASPDIDFLCSPTSYAFRQLGGEGTSHFMSLLGSLHAHGKLWFDENDIRTSLSGGTVGEWGRPADVGGDIVQQDKELANVLVNGAAQWWFDVGGNRYDNPALMERIARLTANATEVLALDRTPADEVAMIVDERSLASLRVADPLGASLLIHQMPILSRIGTPVGHYLVTDLPRIADRPAYLFMTSFAPTEADRAAIDALKGDGRVLVFFYAPGVYRGDSLDEAAMSDLTGIRLRMGREPAALSVRLEGGDALTEGLAGQTTGGGETTFPVCWADDPRAIVLGRFADGRAGLVVKRHPDWTAVFSAVPVLPGTLLRRLAAAAGAHEYVATDDVVWASRGLVAVSAFHAGPRAIHLRHAGTVRDLYTGETIEAPDGVLRADFAERQTRVFVVPSR